MGLCELHKVQQGQVQGHASGSRQPPVSIQAAYERFENSPAEKDTDGRKAGHETPTCAHRPEGQPYPGLHQEKRGQQVDGGDSAPLLCSGETPPGVLHPALDFLAQVGYGGVGASAEEGYKDDHRAGAPLL